jgi:p-methyltransferase
METIEKEIDSIISLGNVRNLVFIDDTFNVPITRFKDICRLLIDRRYNLNWFSYFRCGNADEEAIDLAARSGCKGVFLGIESGSDSILKNMNKAASVDRYRWGIETLRKHNILTFASFIGGFPGETRETFQESIDFIRQTHPDYYRILLWYCESGTPIQNQKERFGITGSGFRWSHNTMTSGDAIELIEQAFMEIDESEWLPQWSFDFWIIPYFLGRGVSLEVFRKIVSNANHMLRMEFLPISPEDKRLRQIDYLRRSADLMSDCPIVVGSSPNSI